MSEIREDLKAFLDGELSLERAAQVQAAIEADPTLREEVEFMKALGFEIKKLKAEPAVQGAEKAIAGVRRGRSSWLRKNGWLMGSGLAAVMLLVIVPPMFRSGSETAMFKPAAHAGIKRDKFGSESSAPQDGFANAGKRGAMESDRDMAGLPAEEPASSVPARIGRPSAAGEGGGGPLPITGGDRLNKAEAPQVDRRNLVQSDGRATAPIPSRPLIPQLLIRTANVAVKVENAQKALADSIRIAQSVGGYSSGDNLSVSEGTTPVATVSLRVPVRSFEKVREDILKLGTMIENNSNTEDVTTQVADTEARLKVLKAEEDSYVTMLRGARRIGDLMEIKDRLSTVRQEIESLDSQRKALRDQASYSTINATFTQKTKVDEPAPPKDWTEDTWANAVNGLKSVGRFLAQGAIFLFVYSPLWLPVLLFGWWMSRRGSKG